MKGEVMMGIEGSIGLSFITMNLTWLQAIRV